MDFPARIKSFYNTIFYFKRTVFFHNSSYNLLHQFPIIIIFPIIIRNTNISY